MKELFFTWDGENIVDNSGFRYTLSNLNLSPYNIGFDMDGVISKDDPANEGKTYAEWIKLSRDHKPLLELDENFVQNIITGRHKEDSLPITLEWLDKHNINYLTLTLKNTAKEKSSRDYKRKQCKYQNIDIYVESDIYQSLVISKQCPCICIEDMELYYDGKIVPKSEAVSRN